MTAIPDKNTALDYTILQPFRHPTMARYKKLFNDPRSILRVLQYEMLNDADTSGKILDFGGGNKSDYRHLLKCTQYDSINIDPSMDPTWIVGIDSAFPCEPNTYDKVVSMSTLEHVYNVPLVLEQIHKALKPDGTLAFAVPFLFRIHGHPDDFNRFTISWWHTTLKALGYTDIKIHLNTWGPYSTGLFLAGYAVPFKRVIAKTAILLDILYSKHAKKAEDYYKSHALGFFITAKK